MRIHSVAVTTLVRTVTLTSSLAVPLASQGRLDVLFLGDHGHHKPRERLHDIHRVMAQRGIDLFYTTDVADLNPTKLARYDCVVLYANHMVLPKKHETALLEFVARGKGFVPIHCASACFANSRAFVRLVGGQFRRHGVGVFTVETTRPQHPAMRGLQGFSSWDETYEHARLTDDRTVLQVRPKKDGGEEPWTWTRTHGKGRVFYTAWGHDRRTWSRPGFHDLIERGIRWASGDRFVDQRPAPPPFAHTRAKVPHYQVGVSRRDMKNLPTMQEPLAPGASLARMRVPPEFAVSLFAAEPKIRKPIAMAWDERGRLWIAETTDYPNSLQRKDGVGNDRITICTDTDRDGVADEFTVFADRLSIPTSIVHVHGGVIVAQAPHFLFLKDVDGDDRADVREIVFTGWSTGDTHAGPSNLRYGFDNQIWGAVGYSGFQGVIGGVKHRFRQGFYRFRFDGEPANCRLEFLISTTNNTWGLAFSEEGFVFGSTANGNPSVYMAIPNRYYEMIAGWSAPRLETIAESTQFHPITDKVRQVDWFGKFTAAAGHALYTARSYPQRYWNRAAFVNAPTGHLLNQFFLDRKGTHFVGRDGYNLLASDDEWTAPIMAEVGPDGAVWVIDWYNYIVQHNPTPRGFETGKGNAYRTPLRDKRHGRIYRVTHRDAKDASTWPSLRGADSRTLVATLANDNMFWRLTAQRLLVEQRPAGAVAQLLARLDDRSVDGLGLNVAVQHALWTLHGLDAVASVDAGVRKALFEHSAAAVRQTALQVLPPGADCAKLLRDPDPHVRLAAGLALADVPSNATPDPSIGSAVFAALADPNNLNDRWLPDALTAAAARHDLGFLQTALLTFEVKGAKARATAVNLLPNPGFELRRTGELKPVAWQVRHYGGRATQEFVKEGRNGGWCVKISSTKGADSSWFASVSVERDADYRFSGWVKTAGVRGRADGALFNVHELQGNKLVKTRAVRGDQDWTRLEVTFNSDGRSEISINCLFGGWGHAVGTVWYDDLQLVRIAGTSLPGRLGRAVTQVMAHYAARAPVDTVAGLLAKMQRSSPALARVLLRGLVAGWPAGVQRRPEFSREDLAAVRRWFGTLDDASAVELACLLGRWGHAASVADPVTQLVGRLRPGLSKGATIASRLAAVGGLIRLLPLLPAARQRAELQRLIAGIRPQTPYAFADGVLQAVASSRADGVGPLILGAWKQFTGRVRRSAARILMRRPPWTHALLDAMLAGDVDPAALHGADWQQLEKHPDATIVGKVSRARTNRPTANRAAVLAKFLPVAKRRGNAAAGKVLFGTHCAVCHVIDGVGGTVGPDLTGSGARERAELLVAILDPNQSVDGTYLMWVIEQKNDEFLAGRLDKESRTIVEILDVLGQRHVVKRSDIRSMEQSPLSLMPANFEHLGAKGLTDLLEYLASSGAPGASGKKGAGK